MKKIVPWDVGVAEGLALVFLAEKLAFKINWSWFWVFAPLWGPLITRGLWWLVKMALGGLQIAIESRRVNAEEKREGPGIRGIPKGTVFH
jgi:hypothetical protein